MSKENSNTNWTILWYAAGYNELEPEIYSSFLEIQEHLPARAVLAAQIARAPGWLVKQFRPQFHCQASDNTWHGTRRMVIRQQGMIHSEVLPDVNMADPNNLLDFIAWAISNFPSSHYMLMISGHGAGFMGIASDYAHGLCLIMSIKGLAEALEQAMHRLKQHIDILVLDACYMNMMEIWYELAHINKNPIHFLVAPVSQLDPSGMPLAKIVHNLATPASPSKAVLKDTLRMINLECNPGSQILLAELDRQYLRVVKKFVHTWARHHAKKPIPANSVSTIPITQLLSDASLHPGFEHALRQAAQKALARICLWPPLSSLNPRISQGPSLYFPANSTEYLMYKPHYDSLLFVQNCDWSKYLADNSLPLPNTIPRSSFVSAMMEQNLDLTPEQAWKAVKDMGWLNSAIEASDHIPFILRKAVECERRIGKPSRNMLLT